MHLPVDTDNVRTFLFDNRATMFNYQRYFLKNMKENNNIKFEVHQYLKKKLQRKMIEQQEIV